MNWATVHTVKAGGNEMTAGKNWPPVTDADCAEAKECWDRERGPDRQGGAREAAARTLCGFLARIQPPGTPVIDWMFDLVFTGVFPRDGQEIDGWAAAQWRPVLEATRGLASGELAVDEATRTLTRRKGQQGGR